MSSSSLYLVLVEERTLNMQPQGKLKCTGVWANPLYPPVLYRTAFLTNQKCLSDLLQLLFFFRLKFVPSLDLSVLCVYPPLLLWRVRDTGDCTVMCKQSWWHATGTEAVTARVSLWE